MSYPSHLLNHPSCIWLSLLESLSLLLAWELCWELQDPSPIPGEWGAWYRGSVLLNEWLICHLVSGVPSPACQPWIPPPICPHLLGTSLLSFSKLRDFRRSLEVPLWLSEWRTWHCLYGDVGLILGLAQWVKKLLWLWHGPAAAALIWPLAWEFPYAAGVTIKKKKKRKISIFLSQLPSYDFLRLC